MSEKIVRRTYLCPIIGAGSGLDEYRPKIADISPISSWFIHELGKTRYCLCTVVAPVSEHVKIIKDKDVKMIATRKKIELPEKTLAALKENHPDFDFKFEAVKKSSIWFRGETGE